MATRTADWSSSSRVVTRRPSPQHPICRFRGGLAFKAHRLLYHSTLGLRVIKKKKKLEARRHSPPKPPASYLQRTSGFSEFQP